MKKVKNIVAKHAHMFNKPLVFKDKTKYCRKGGKNNPKDYSKIVFC